jgi:hypothetical protein
MDKFPVTDVLKYFLVLSIVLGPPVLDAQQPLDVINDAHCPLKPRTDEPQLFVNRLVLAFFHNVISGVGSKFVLSEGQERINGVDRLPDSIVLPPGRVMRS